MRPKAPAVFHSFFFEMPLQNHKNWKRHAILDAGSQGGFPLLCRKGNGEKSPSSIQAKSHKGSVSAAKNEWESCASGTGSTLCYLLRKRDDCLVGRRSTD